MANKLNDMARKIEQTMREFKKGTLRSSNGRKVTSRKQAIAIGLSQARAISSGDRERLSKGSDNHGKLANTS